MLNSQYRPLIILLLMVMLFIIPVWMAHWLYYEGNHFVKHYSNHGTLIKPSLDLRHFPLKNLQGTLIKNTPFAGEWTLLSLSPTYNATSLKNLYTLRQIRLMLGKNRDKIQRVLLFYDAKKPVQIPSTALIPYAGSQLFLTDRKNWLALFATRPLYKKSAALDGVFIVDPQGQLIMGYESPINPKHIMQDLHRLIGPV